MYTPKTRGTGSSSGIQRQHRDLVRIRWRSTFLSILVRYQWHSSLWNHNSNEDSVRAADIVIIWRRALQRKIRGKEKDRGVLKITLGNVITRDRLMSHRKKVWRTQRITRMKWITSLRIKSIGLLCLQISFHAPEANPASLWGWAYGGRGEGVDKG